MLPAHLHPPKGRCWKRGYPISLVFPVGGICPRTDGCVWQPPDYESRRGPRLDLDKDALDVGFLQRGVQDFGLVEGNQRVFVAMNNQQRRGIARD